MSADPLAVVELAAAALASHPDLEVRAIGAWLATCPAELLAWLGAENSAGRSARQAVLLARRDEIIRRIRLPTSRLARDLAQYHSDCWPRHRLLDLCPYAPQDPRSQYWQLLRLVPRPPGLRRIHQIRFDRAIGPPFHFTANGDR
jgi:hypothetical protein